MTTVAETPAVASNDASNDSSAKTEVTKSDETNNTNNAVVEDESKKTSDTATDESNKEAVSAAKPKPTVHKTDYEEGKVYLYQFERCASLPSSSSHCLKLETFLRLANIPYENVDHKMRYKSSKGDMPFVELNGREIAETDVTIEELSKEFKVDLNSDLTAEQKVIAHALESMLENHTAWIIKHWRFKHPQEFLKVSGTDIKKTINSKLPQSVLNFMFKIGFKSNIKDLIGHGIGRLDAEQVYASGRKDLEMLSNALGDKQYFFGDKPRLLDATAFSILAQFVFVPFESYDEFIKNDTPNLFKFVERMKEQYWSDWDTICQAVDVSGKKEGESDDTKKSDEAIEEEKKKKEELKKEKEEKKRKEKEEKERKKKEEKEEKERKKREAKEKAEKEKAEKEKAEKEKAEKEKAEKEKAAAEKKEGEAKAESKEEAEGTEKSGAEESKSESQTKTGAEGGEKSEEKADDTQKSEQKSG